MRKNNTKIGVGTIQGLKRIILIILVLVNLGCDQVSKDIVRKNVPTNANIQLLGEYLILTNVENTGAMLGFGAHWTPTIKWILLKLLPLAVLLFFLIRILQRHRISRIEVLGFAMVIGGGIGNLLDRMLHGSVTDFLQIRMGGLQTGIFNMADVSVTLGIILILGSQLIARSNDGDITDGPAIQ